MANPTSGILLQNILNAFTGVNESLQLRNPMIDRIYWDVQPIVAVPYQSLTIPIPTIAEGNVVDIGAGPIQPTDYAYITKSITLDKNYSDSFIIKDWDQARTPLQLRQVFFQPRMEELSRRINRLIVGQFNTTNFGTGTTPAGYSIITGVGTNADLQRVDISTAWKNLAQAGVAVDDPANMTLLVDPSIYAAWLANSNFINQY